MQSPKGHLNVRTHPHVVTNKVCIQSAPSFMRYYPTTRVTIFRHGEGIDICCSQSFFYLCRCHNLKVCKELNTRRYQSQTRHPHSLSLCPAHSFLSFTSLPPLFHPISPFFHHCCPPPVLPAPPSHLPPPLPQPSLRPPTAAATPKPDYVLSSFSNTGLDQTD